jgi:PAS domain S-box-containing protein
MSDEICAEDSQMNGFLSGRLSVPSAFSPWRIAIIYLGAAFAWFLITAEVIGRIFGIRVDVLLIRGPLFTLVTALLLYLLVMRYVTELRRSNAELQESTAHATAYFESAVEGIVSIDDSGLIVGANRTIEKLFGYSPAELTGKPIETLIPERLRRVHEQHRERFFQAPQSRPMGLGLKLVGRRKDGSEFPVELSLTVTQTDQGRFVIAFVMDITERLALEHEARRGETLTTLGMVAAGIVHEINNPIGIIASRAELLLDDPSVLSPSLRADLEVLRRNALRVGRISQGLLTLARHGRPKTFTRIDVNDVIEDALLLVSKQMSEESIHIETALEASLPPVSGDPTALEEVIINLLLNARQAIGGSGSIRVQTQHAPQPADQVQIIVADDGPGIPTGTIERLFDPFFSTKATGLGIGLWLSRRIISEHRGDISVESEIGSGTRFLIKLPEAVS